MLLFFLYISFQSNDLFEIWKIYHIYTDIIYIIIVLKTRWYCVCIHCARCCNNPPTFKPTQILFFSSHWTNICSRCVKMPRFFFSIQFHRHPSGALIFFSHTYGYPNVIVSHGLVCDLCWKTYTPRVRSWLTLSQKIILYYIYCAYGFMVYVYTHTLTHTHNIYVSHNTYNFAEWICQLKGDLYEIDTFFHSYKSYSCYGFYSTTVACIFN